MIQHLQTLKLHLLSYFVQLWNQHNILENYPDAGVFNNGKIIFPWQNQMQCVFDKDRNQPFHLISCINTQFHTVTFAWMTLCCFMKRTCLNQYFMFLSFFPFSQSFLQKAWSAKTLAVIWQAVRVTLELKHHACLLQYIGTQTIKISTDCKWAKSV